MPLKQRHTENHMVPSKTLAIDGLDDVKYLWFNPETSTPTLAEALYTLKKMLETLDKKEVIDFVHECLDKTSDQHSFISRIIFNTSLLDKEKYIEKASLYQTREKLKSSVGLYSCRRCKGKNVSDYQRQTRAADEPLTVFCNCMDCGLSWRIN